MVEIHGWQVLGSQKLSSCSYEKNSSCKVEMSQEEMMQQMLTSEDRGTNRKQVTPKGVQAEMTKGAPSLQKYLRKQFAFD